MYLRCPRTMVFCNSQNPSQYAFTCAKCMENIPTSTMGIIKNCNAYFINKDAHHTTFMH